MRANGVVRDGRLYRVAFVVPGSPGVGSLNAKHKIAYLGKRCHVCKRGRPKIVSTTDAEAWKRAAVMMARAAAAIAAPDRRMMPHAVAVRMSLWWPRLHRKDPHLDGLALGDVDACAKLTLDALAEAGVIYDDGQVTDLAIRKGYDADDPRVAVVCQRIDDETETT